MKINQEDKRKIKRAAIHVLSGVVIIVLASFFSFATKFLLVLLVLGIVLSLLSVSYRIPIICLLIDNCEREIHKKTLPGKSSLFFLAGSILSLVLFEKNIALASIAILTIGDPVAHFASRIKNKSGKRRTLFGLAITSIISILASSIFISWKYAIPASMLAMISESFIIRVWKDTIDDNIVIPIVAGSVVYVCKLFF